MQRILPAGIRPYLSKQISCTIIELCNFFQLICARTLKTEDLEKVEEHIVLVLSKLEMIFPPAFFDIMAHLSMHLPEKAIMGGPVQMRWMYPFERFMKTLKEYVRNRAKPEGSIAEGYVVTEALTFCSKYLKDVETKFNRPERNQDLSECVEEAQLSVFKSIGRTLGKASTLQLDEKPKRIAEWYILNNCEEVQPYFEYVRLLCKC